MKTSSAYLKIELHGVSMIRQTKEMGVDFKEKYAQSMMQYFARQHG